MLSTSGVFKTVKNPANLQMPTTVSPDGRGKKRKVTAADEEEVESKKQKQSATVPSVNYVMKSEILVEGAKPSNLSGAHPELFLERLQGNIELVWYDDGKKEGFIDPFAKAYFHCDRKNPNAVKTFEELKKKTGIFVGVSRRISQQMNEPQLKQGNQGGMFKLTYFVCHRDGNKSDLELDHRVCLETIADVS
jgi:hypothetical protein